MFALDAFRIESAPDEEQGAMSAGYIFGYRLALLMSGAGALYIADASGWSAAYLTMAALMAVGMLATLWGDEPKHVSRRQQRQLDAQMVDAVMGRPMRLESRPFLQRQLLGAVICPLLEFMQRYRRFRSAGVGAGCRLPAVRHCHGRNGQSLLPRSWLQQIGHRQHRQAVRILHDHRRFRALRCTGRAPGYPPALLLLGPYSLPGPICCSRRWP
jgi:hypothetical protein